MGGSPKKPQDPPSYEKGRLYDDTGRKKGRIAEAQSKVSFNDDDMKQAVRKAVRRKVKG